MIFVRSSFFVKAYLRDVIYDLNRNDYRFIPSDVIEPEQWTNRKISELAVSVDLSILEFLFQEEHIFLSPHVADTERFPEIDLYFEPGYHFINTILFLQHKDFCVQATINLLQKLSELGVKHLICYAQQYVDPKSIAWLLDHTKTMDFITVEFIVPHGETISEEMFVSTFENNARIRKITYYGADHACKLYEEWPVYQVAPDLSKALIPAISPDQMSPDMEIFKESHTSNVFYNGKLIVDLDGNLYESIYFDTIYSNIFEAGKKETGSLNNKRYASVTKDMIDVCRVCEFRHMCLDSEIPMQRADGSYFRKNECQYNPFIAKWTVEEG